MEWSELEELMGQSSEDTQPTISDSQEAMQETSARPTSTVRKKRSRCWRFTDFTSTHAWTKLPTGVRYAVMQQEVCPETMRVHLQGYIQLLKPQEFTWLKRLRPHANWGTCNGTPAQNREYCTKEDSRLIGGETCELGEITSQGGRTDFKEFKDAVKGGARKRHLMDDYPSIFARYRNFYGDIRAVGRPTRDFKGVVLLVGPTGVGKTRKVIETYQDSGELWVSPVGGGGSWFDRYDGHKYALIDDFSGEMPLRDALRVLDRYPILVPVKGGFTWWIPEIVFVTTNNEPGTWYKWEGREEQKAALYRRFTDVGSFSPDGTCTDMLGTEYFGQ